MLNILNNNSIITIQILLVLIKILNKPSIIFIIRTKFVYNIILILYYIIYIYSLKFFIKKKKFIKFSYLV